MFTPQRKGWSGLSLTPRSGTQKNGSASRVPEDRNLGSRSVAKGKIVALGEAQPKSPSGSEDVAADREVLVDKVVRLENELFEYQYNMGLLLIEKKEWNSKAEELRQALVEVEDALQCERAAHLTAISEVEKREESLRKALGIEKQCVLDLEKALRDLRSEYAEIKFASDSKLGEANALFSSIEEKSAEIEAKLHASNAELADVSRKSSEIQRRRQEVEAQEKNLQRERLLFNTEREAKEAALSEQREDLQQWERKLHEGEERLAERRRTLNQQEERANENERILKQKEDDLQEAQKKVDVINLNLKRNEEEINSKLGNLSIQEKKADAMKKSLEAKEKELFALEEKLNARERVEMQKLVDEHNAILAAKKHEFELETDLKRKSLDQDLKARVIELEKKESEISHLEDKVAKRGQALEKKLEKFKEKEKELDLNLKALKENEKSIRDAEKHLDLGKKQMLVEKENLLSLKAELEKVRADNEEQLSKILSEKDQLKVAEEERSEFRHLQLELKQEIDNWRRQKELVSKEIDDLKQERQNFERQWDELDVKRAKLKKDLEEINFKKSELEKLKHSEEERLKNEKMATDDHIKRELQALEFAKETFAASVEHDKSVMIENARSEKSKLLDEFEMRRRELETALQKRQEEMETALQQRKKIFEETRDKELNSINYQREVAQKEMEDMKLERLRLEKDKQEIAANMKDFESQQLEIRGDIDELVILSGKLKGRREQFIKDREHFIAFVEKLKDCQYCGELTREFVLSDLQSLADMEDAEIIPLPRVSDIRSREGTQADASARQNGETTPVAIGSKSPSSSKTMSLLRKCTSKLFNFSPVKKIEPVAVENPACEGLLSGEQDTVIESKGLGSIDCGPDLSLGIASDSFQIQTDNSISKEAGIDQSIDDVSNTTKDIEAGTDQSKSRRGKLGKRGRPRVSRTRSVKAVVEDAKAIYGKELEQNASDHRNGDPGKSALIKQNGRKRNRALTSQTTSDYDGNKTHERSDSELGSQTRKRRVKAAPFVQTGEKRYNLRRPRNPNIIASASSNPNKDKLAADGDGERDPISKAALSGVGSEHDESTRIQFKTGQDVYDGKAESTMKSVEITVLSEEVNGSVEVGGDDGNIEEYQSKSITNDALDNEDEDDGETDHLGEASIGKKLWNFLTT